MIVHAGIRYDQSQKCESEIKQPSSAILVQERILLSNNIMIRSPIASDIITFQQVRYSSVLIGGLLNTNRK